MTEAMMTVTKTMEMEMMINNCKKYSKYFKFDWMLISLHDH